MELKCPHCGSLNVDYSDCYDTEITFDVRRKNDIVIRKMNGYCGDCNATDLLWEEIYEFVGVRDIVTNNKERKEKMKVKVYVDWYGRRVINEKEFKEKVEEVYEDYKKDNDYFAEWLCDHYSAGEIWNLDEERRREVRSDFLVECEKLGVRDVREGWEENEIEV